MSCKRFFHGSLGLNVRWACPIIHYLICFNTKIQISGFFHRLSRHSWDMDPCATGGSLVSRVCIASLSVFICSCITWLFATSCWILASIGLLEEGLASRSSSGARRGSQVDWGFGVLCHLLEPSRVGSRDSSLRAPEIFRFTATLQVALQ